MEVIRTDIPDVKVLAPKRHGDARGFLSETYNRRMLAELGISGDFVQDNHSMSSEANVVRGLHYQIPPFAQDKLIRVARGAIKDVAVDVRRGSPTFGKHVAVILSAENWRQIFIPAGFAHGFVTLEPNTEVLYKVSNYYAPQHERGIRWNDPALAIEWGIDASSAILSPRDREHPMLGQVREGDLFR